MALEPAEMCCSNKMLQVLLKMINVSKAVFKKKQRNGYAEHDMCFCVL